VTRAWAFPRHRPQIYAPTGRTLVGAQDVYSYGRDIRLARVGIRLALMTPGVRRALSRRTTLQLPMDEATWRETLTAASRLVSLDHWAIFRSSWRNERFILFGFDHRHRCTGVIHAFPRDHVTFHPLAQATLFRVPEIIGTQDVNAWHVRVVEPIPPRHRPFGWNPARIVDIGVEVSRLLAGAVSSPGPVPEDWVPVHGDMTPWNMRVDRNDRVWLIDWEWATIAPPATDLLRFALTHRSLRTDDPDELVSWLTSNLPVDDVAIRAAARQWLSHRMYAPSSSRTSRTEDVPGVSAARGQAAVEAQVLERLATYAE